MTSQQQTDILNSVQEIVRAISDWKIKVLSTTQYSDSNVTGIKIDAWVRGIQYPFFVGFSSDEKFSDRLVFGVLSQDRDEYINKIKMTDDKFGNGIKKSYKFSERFFRKKSNEQKEFIKDWVFIYTWMDIFSDDYKFANRKHAKELLKDTPTDYANISYSKWFLLVELPWIVMILGILIMLILFRKFGTYTSKAIYLPLQNPYGLAAKTGIVFMAVGFIAILSTIGLKLKIRQARNQKTTKSPFSWFTSYVGKFAGGITFGILILAWKIAKPILKIALTESAPNGGASTQKAEPSFYCKWCGYKASSVQSLVSYSCSRSPTRKHELYEGPEQSVYYCECCGYRSPTIQTLTSYSCSNSPTKKHIPFEGGEKSQYTCKFCGYKSPTIQILISYSCSQSPTKKHQPAK